MIVRTYCRTGHGGIGHPEARRGRLRSFSSDHHPAQSPGQASITRGPASLRSNCGQTLPGWLWDQGGALPSFPSPGEQLPTQQGRCQASHVRSLQPLCDSHLAFPSGYHSPAPNLWLLTLQTSTRWFLLTARWSPGPTPSTTYTTT